MSEVVSEWRTSIGDEKMLTVDETEFQEHFQEYMNRVTVDREAIAVIRENGKNVVVMPEAVFENLRENLFVLGSKVNYDWLMESKGQLEKK